MPVVLCVSAHPDDAEVGCSATVRRFIEQGYEAYLLVLTNGENGFKIGEMSAEKRVAIRRKEQQAAARFWGMKEVFFFDYRDGFLQYTEDLRARLVKVIKTLRPEIVFTFDPANRTFEDLNRQHRDHRITGEVVFDACFAARNLWMYPGKPHAVNEIYFFLSHVPNRFEDISDKIDFKIKLLSHHHSQFPDEEWLKNFVKQRINPPQKNLALCEAFRVIPGKRV